MSDIPLREQPTQDPSPSVTTLDATLPIARNGPRGAGPEIAAGQRFGEYELLTEVARGGMGVVYRARQVALDRVVALKMILTGRLANDDEVQRFRAEAGAAAKLHHPNIVAIYDTDVCDGHHFFTMEFIDGTSLDRKLADGPLPSKVAARYVRILARAVAYAHKQGILHRDLKPSNILVDANDEPHITDFGLAKNLRGSSAQTRTGAVLGTPSYMSPEQAQGKTGEIGPACDVYSLGAVLYELITGRPPFRAESPLDTVMQVIDNQPVPPRLLNPNIDHDLETICLKCLEKSPKSRYASADELADDLQRYLEGDSISARSFNVLDRLARTLERDHHTINFSEWSSMVMVMAFAVGAEHIAVFGMVKTGLPSYCIIAARGLLFLALGWLFVRHRGSRLLPTNAAERELWTIWIGYFVTYFFIVAVNFLLYHFGVLHPDPDWPAKDYFRELLPYPFLTLVSGLAFFVMGANYWGRCYAIGLAYFVVAVVMTFDLTLGPLIFGLLWAAVLATLSRHLREQGRMLAAPQTPTPSQVETVLFPNKLV